MIEPLDSQNSYVDSVGLIRRLPNSRSPDPVELHDQLFQDFVNQHPHLFNLAEEIPSPFTRVKRYIRSFASSAQFTIFIVKCSLFGIFAHFLYFSFIYCCEWLGLGWPFGAAFVSAFNALLVPGINKLLMFSVLFSFYFAVFYSFSFPFRSV